MSVEGAVLAQRKAFSDAEKMLLASHATLTQAPGSGSRTFYIQNTRYYLAALYEAWGKPDEAKKYAVVEKHQER